jgi:thiamine-phosphate pyrophosphorylase
VSASLHRVGRLHVITDTTVQDRFDHEQLARLAIAGGADTIQLRDKSMSDDDLAAVARGVLAVCRAAGVPLIVNDRIHVARAAGADGVHLGREDAPVAAARAALGPGAIIGGSASTEDEAAQVAAAGADYVGFGHVFPTTSKHKQGPPVGLDGLARACRAARIPVVAIGGITAGTAGDVVAAGAWGVAVIGAVCAAADPMEAARGLAVAVETARSRRNG